MTKSDCFEVKLQLRPYKDILLNEILDFSTQNPVLPSYSRTQLKNFITQLVSSQSLIYDIYRDDYRVAVAVLLDKISNPSGSANLEIIGRNNVIEADDLFMFLLSKLPSSIPLQIGTHETLKPSDKVLEKFGYEFLYHTYEMKKVDAYFPKYQIPVDVQFVRLSLQTYEEYYKVLVKSFESNLETSIPPIEEMKENFRVQLQSKPAGTNLIILNEKIVGFYTVSLDDNDSKMGEVHMLGILPEMRGKGLGNLALSMAINELSNLNCERYHLTVAAQNQSALSLYKKFGFMVEQTYTAYLRN